MFADSNQFRYVEMSDGGPLFPVHHRPLGVKEGGMYSKSVRWADVVINDVPLEKTFENEDMIEYISSQRDDGNYEREVMMVNSRDYLHEKVVVDEKEGKYDNAYRRLQNIKISPMTFKQAKKKKPSKDKRSSKSKGNHEKHRVEKEKHLTFNERFKDVVSTNDHGILSKNIMSFDARKRAKPLSCPDDTPSCGPLPPGWRPRPALRRFDLPGASRTPDSMSCKTFVPPVHWIEPIKRWDLIWSAVDEMVNGRKREYHYLEPGVEGEDGILGPAIYFYDKNDDDLNYSFDWKTDFIYGELDEERSPMWYNKTPTKDEELQANYSSFCPTRNISPNFIDFPGEGYWHYGMVTMILSLSDTSASAYSLDQYLMNPTDFNYEMYVGERPSVWKNGVVGYVRERGSEAPTPHL